MRGGSSGNCGKSWAFGLGARGTLALAALLGSVAAAAPPASVGPYPSMAAAASYAMPRDGEVALARTAAPAAVSRDAEVLVLGARGYERAEGGSNGFVCLVERSWNAAFGNPEFWNPRVRAPICYDAVAARAVLPIYLERTRLALAGASRDAIGTAEASGPGVATPVGAMSYMTSKDAYLGDQSGHAHPHLMFYLDRVDPAVLGANLPGSPLLGFAGDATSPTIVIVPMGRWSDGSPAS